MCQSRNVRRRARQALDEPAAYYIGDIRKDNWHVPHHLLSRKRGYVANRDDEVGFELDQLGCPRWQPFELAICRSIVDEQVTALHPAEVTERLSEDGAPNVSGAVGVR